MDTTYQQLWDAVNYAARAPSSHNAQPWLVAIDSVGIQISLDASRTTPEADPEYKSAYMSIGVFIESLSITLEARGYTFTVETHADPEFRCVFKSVEQSSKNSVKRENDLYVAISERYTYRGLFQDTAIPQAVLDQLQDLAAVDTIRINSVQETDAIERLLKTTLEGLRNKYTSFAFRKEVKKWFRNHHSRKQDGLHSRALSMKSLQSIVFSILLPWFNPYTVVSKKIAANIDSSQAAICISSSDSSVDSLIAAGRSVQRVLLFLHANGVAASIYMAGLSNDSLESTVSDIFRFTDTTPQFMFFIGYPQKEHRNYMTPRIDLSA